MSPVGIPSLALVALGSLAAGQDRVETATPRAAATADRSEPTPYERSAPRADVRVFGTPGRERIDVSARRALTSSLMRQIGLQAGREVLGVDLLSRDPAVTAGLEDADLRDALKWIGGSVGLKITLTATEIEVVEDLPAYPTREELYERAAGGYFRALVDYPSSVLAPSARWNRARIEASREGRALDAARAYDELIEKHPDSELVPQALLESGRLYGQADVWDEATIRFDTLAGYPIKHPLSVTARRLLADAHTRVADRATNPVVREENARRALLVVDALDDQAPTQDPLERRERYIVRSRGHSLAGQPTEAMKCLDLAIQYSRDSERDPELAELRAQAFERARRPGDAVRAWLFHSTLVDGDERVRAYRRAAGAANEGGEYVTTFAIAASAKKLGFGDAIAPFADEAWTALDMEPQRLDLFGDPERIARGARLVEKGEFAEAVRALRPVFERRAGLEEIERLTLGRAYATALAEVNRLEDALLVLRKTASGLVQTGDRVELYLLASNILERAGELERAIAAIQGRL